MAVLDEEKICTCALNRIFGYEPRIAVALLDCLGSAEAVFRLDNEKLGEILGPFSGYPAKINAEAVRCARKELEEAEKLGIAFIGRGDDAYPEMLRECEDSPAGLYVRSPSPLTCLAPGREYISIVGTRNISGYGKEWCERIVEALAGTGRSPVIVSGLAYGTDITAHLAAMEYGLDTIAVMATGADSIYPAMHRKYAERIAKKDGSALISDYPLHTQAIALNFVRRNRIIAGIGKATILIESRAHGGGMITARQAFSYNREVYALPGRADDPMSQGCNALIRSGCAIPVTSEKSLLESLGLPHRKRKMKKRQVADYYEGSLSPDKTEKLAEIILLIKKNRLISLQDLSEISGMEYRRVAELAGILENDGFISIDMMQRCSINRKNS